MEFILPGVNFVNDASVNTDGTGSHINFVLPGCCDCDVDGDDDPLPPVLKGLHRLRFVGR